MRATKGYVAGVGTTSALIGAIGCAFALLTAVVAVHGWPLELRAPGTSTVEGRAPAGEDAWSAFHLLPAEHGRVARPHGRTRRGRAHGVVHTPSGPFASAFGPAASERVHETDGPAAGRAPLGGSAAGTAGSVPDSRAGATTAPVAGAGAGAPGGDGTTAPPPASDGSPTTLGGAVTEIASGAGTTVAQTGQQLADTTQGATTQLGDAVGQVSPAAGQAVTQAGQAAGGVVGGATSAAGQVVSGAGTTVGGLLGRLTSGR